MGLVPLLGGHFPVLHFEISILPFVDPPGIPIPSPGLVTGRRGRPAATFSVAAAAAAADFAVISGLGSWFQRCSSHFLFQPFLFLPRLPFCGFFSICQLDVSRLSSILHSVRCILGSESTECNVHSFSKKACHRGGVFSSRIFFMSPIQIVLCVAFVSGRCVRVLCCMHVCSVLFPEVNSSRARDKCAAEQLDNHEHTLADTGSVCKERSICTVVAHFCGANWVS